MEFSFSIVKVKPGNAPATFYRRNEQIVRAPSILFMFSHITVVILLCSRTEKIPEIF